MNTVVKRITRLAAAAFPAAACLSPVPAINGGGEARMLFSIEQDGFSATKTSSTCGENEISCIQLIVADESGIIAADIFSDSTDGLVFTGTEGHVYTVYALANDPSGEQVGFQTLEELLSYSFRSSLGSISGHGIPMSTVCRGILLHEGDNPVEIRLVRLYARLDFKIDLKGMPHRDDFSVSSLRLCRGNMEMRPFSAMAMEDISMSGEPDHASASDLTTLAGGGTVSFYVPENMQGVLLGGNSDPWAKVPDSIPAKQNLCTYLEAVCSYSAQGLSSESLTYRMYLGGDNVTDFNIQRNMIYRLTLSPTENEMKGERGSWKIVSLLWSDSRSIVFSPSSLTVPSLGSAAVEVLCSPDDFEYSISGAGFDEAGSSWSLSGGTLTVTNGSGLENDALATLRALSWDGAVEADLSVRIKAAIHGISIEPLDDVRIPYGESCRFRISANPPSLDWSWVLSASSDGAADYFMSNNTGSAYEGGILTITNLNPSHDARNGFLRAWLDENTDISASLGITLEGNPDAPWLEVSPRYLYIPKNQSGSLQVTLHNCSSYNCSPGMSNPTYVVVTAGTVSNGSASVTIDNRNKTANEVYFDVTLRCGEGSAAFSRKATVVLRGTTVNYSCGISPGSATIPFGSSQVFNVQCSPEGYTYTLEGEGLSIASRTANSITVTNNNRSGATVSGWLDVTNGYDSHFSARALISAPSGAAGLRVNPSTLVLGYNDTAVIRVESPSGEFSWDISSSDERLVSYRTGNLIVLRNANTSGADADYSFTFRDAVNPSVTANASVRAESISIGISPDNALIRRGDTGVFTVSSEGEWLWELDNGAGLAASSSGNTILVTNNNNSDADLQDVLRVRYKAWPEISASAAIQAKARETAVTVEHEIVVVPSSLTLSVGESAFPTATYVSRIYVSGILTETIQEDVTTAALWNVSNYEDASYVSASHGAITGLAVTPSPVNVSVTYGLSTGTVGVTVR